MKNFKIVMEAGCTRHDMFTNLTEKEAVELCDSYGWLLLDENEFEWDLYIEEM